MGDNRRDGGRPAADGYDPESERHLLDILVSNPGAVDRVPRLRPADFADPRARDVFAAFLRLLARGVEANPITLWEELSAAGSRVEPVYLAKIQWASAANIEHYEGTVRRYALARRTARLLAEIGESLGPRTVEEALGRLDAFLTEVTTEAAGGRIRRLREVLPEALAAIEAERTADSRRRVPCGLANLDRYLHGFRPRDLVVLGARTSIGKTALAVGLANHIAVEKKIPVGYFTLEMGAEQIAVRILGHNVPEAGGGGEPVVHAQSMANTGGIVGVAGMDILLDTCQRIESAPLYIDDTPAISSALLRARARAMKRLGARILFLDYLTLVRHGDPRMKRPERVGELTKLLKALAGELDLPIVALSQVGRESEGHMPTLADLRQSGEIEEDADVIVLLHRSRKEAPTLAEAEVAKQRNGPTGGAHLLFQPARVRFVDRAEAYEEAGGGKAEAEAEKPPRRRDRRKTWDAPGGEGAEEEEAGAED